MENVRANITNLLIVETAMQQGDYNSIEARIKGIYLNINKDYINSLQRTDDGIIDTFYNMLLSSHVIAEIEDMKKCVYDYSNEETVPQEITDLFMDELFNLVISYEEFKKLVTRKKADLEDDKTRKIWSLILGKNNVTVKDLENIKNADYNFALKYAETIAEYIFKDTHKKKSIALGEWIIVFQELMRINQDKITYKNTGVGHTNTNLKLTAAIKDFENASKLPYNIVHKRIANRLILLYSGTRDLFEIKSRIDNYIYYIEKVVFSYKNIEDIKTAHNYLYFWVMQAIRQDSTAIASYIMLNNRIQQQLKKQNLPMLYLNCFTKKDILLRNSNDNMEFVFTLSGVYNPTKSPQFNALMRVLELDLVLRGNQIEMEFTCPKNAIDNMAIAIADVIKKRQDDRFVDITPSPIEIYFDENNQYKLYFDFGVCNNFIIITYVGFLGKDMKSSQKYYELRLANNQTNNSKETNSVDS